MRVYEGLLDLMQWLAGEFIHFWCSLIAGAVASNRLGSIA